MKLMRQNAKKRRTPEGGWNCKRLLALLRAFLQFRYRLKPWTFVPLWQYQLTLKPT
jgi:hypothetical protein